MRKGQKHSKETLLKISQSRKGKWLGHIVTEETRRKISQSNTGKIRTPEQRAILRSYNLGKKQSEETKRKRSLAMTGKKMWSEEDRKQISKRMKGEGNHRWKGDQVRYSGLHWWVRKILGNPPCCEHCSKKGEKTGKIRPTWNIHWANKSRQYLRDISDWIGLCNSCHKIYDKKG